MWSILNISKIVERVKQKYTGYIPENQNKNECLVQLKITLNDSASPFGRTSSRLPDIENEIVNKQVNEWLEKA